MNRPRNRQPRPPRQQTNPRPRNGGRGDKSGGANVRVPTVQQVVPGAAVSIVLKEDQPTGRETPGVVMDVLTSGNHPRGIKVRLRDGQVGRVQRMTGSETTSTTTNTTSSTTAAATTSRFQNRYTDYRQDDEFPSEPPPRSLADFIPDEPAPSIQKTAVCPICETFEGDEMAVSHHVDRDHLT